MGQYVEISIMGLMGIEVTGMMFRSSKVVNGSRPGEMDVLFQSGQHVFM